MRGDAIGRKNASSRLGEQARIDARIEADRHGAIHTHMRLDVIGDTLGSFAHRVDIHTIGACAEHAAKTSRTELEFLKECIFYRLGIGTLAHLCELRRQDRLGYVFTPAIEFALVIHGFRLHFLIS